jgi:hypothetical protein
MRISIGLWAVTVMSCGGSTGGNGTCGQVEPCNGPVVGTWKAAAACATAGFVMNLQGTCPEATISGVTATQSGTYTFNADLTYSIAVTGQLTYDSANPASCNPGGMSCAALATAESALSGGTLTCTGSGACNCHGSFTENDTETGTYSVAGTVITMVNSASGYTLEQLYCVQGNTLHILDVDASTNLGPMDQATILDDATYTKQ